MNCKLSSVRKKKCTENTINDDFLSSDVSHLFLIDPLVETLFDNDGWKDYWYSPRCNDHSRSQCFSFARYNKLIPRLHAMQLSAAMGINRVLVLTHLIDTPLTSETIDHQEDNDLHINHRQVDRLRRRKTKLFSFDHCRNICFAMRHTLVRPFVNITT